MATVKRNTVTITTAEIRFTERELKDIVLAHVVANYGSEWRDAQISIWQQDAPVVMGQIDDMVEIAGRAKLVVEE